MRHIKTITLACSLIATQSACTVKISAKDVKALESEILPELSYDSSPGRSGNENVPMKINPSVFKTFDLPVTCAFEKPEVFSKIGLSIDSQCVISGTPTGGLDPANYNVVISGDFGSVKAPVYLSITKWCTGAYLTNTPFASGDGSAGSPYRVCTADQLANINTSYPDQKFELWDDLDLTGYNCLAIGGTLSNRFTGTFDGRNKTISNFTCNSAGSNFVGLFPATDTGAVIKNLVMSNGWVKANSNVGILVGQAVNAGTFTNITVSGSILGNASTSGGVIGNLGAGATVSNITSYVTITAGATAAYVGGAFGYANSSMSNVTSSGSVSVTNASATSYVGGLVGRQGSGTISNSSSSATVTSAGGYVGGLVGGNTGTITITGSSSSGNVTGVNAVGGLMGLLSGVSTITLSHSSSRVSASGTYAGGLVGQLNSNGVVSKSYATGAVSSSSTQVGGLVGYQANSATVSNSYSRSSVSGSSDVGGLVGYHGGSAMIATSYFAGTITSAGTKGSLVGTQANTNYTSLYYDSDLSSIAAVGNGGSPTGTNSADTSTMKKKSTFDSNGAGWSESIWLLKNGQYPSLL